MAYFRDVVGIDVSKQYLDLYVLSGQQRRTVANTAAGYGDFVSWLKSLGVRMAVMEASGGYERDVAKALRQAGFDVRIVDPKRVRHFAKAAGRLAKNDRIDAEMIAEFGAVFAAAQRCEIPLDAKREHLAGLVAARQALMGHQTSLQNQISACPKGPARQALAAALKPIPASIKQLDRLIAKAIAALIAWLPELGRLDRRALAALVGVAPFDDDSGKRTGQRYIKGGRGKLRNIAYMAVMGAATKHNPVLKAYYDSLLNRGKLKKVALIACLRKLLTILNTMVAKQQDWNPASIAIAA